MEKFSSFKRVAGAVSETEKQNILNKQASIFSEQNFPELKQIEREKTPDERDILKLTDSSTNELLEKYGVKGFVIPINNVHIVSEKDWPNDQGSAFYSSMAQAVAVREAPAKIVFLKKVFHEMLHFKSYNALQVTTDQEAKTDQYRVGLTVVTRDGKKQYFKYLNEAVTEELTKRHVTKLFNNPLFSEEQKRTTEIMARYPEAKAKSGQKLFDNEVYYADTADFDTWKDAVGRLFGNERNRQLVAESFSYKKERDFLYLLIGRIYQENIEDFKDIEEIFDLFAQAALTGNLLSIGKLIDKTFGAGTFRKIGEMGNNLNVDKEIFDSIQGNL